MNNCLNNCLNSIFFWIIEIIFNLEHLQYCITSHLIAIFCNFNIDRWENIMMMICAGIFHETARVLLVNKQNESILMLLVGMKTYHRTMYKRSS